jgi:hypothetical protein
MTCPESGYLPPQLDRQPAKPRNVLPIVLGVMALFVALIVIGGFALFKSAAGTTAAAQQSAVRFLTLIQQHDYSAARAMMTPAAQRVTSVSVIRNLSETEEKSHGKLLSWGKPGWYVQDLNGVVYVRLAYPLQYSQYQSNAVIVMQDLGNSKYGVYNFNFQL